MATNCIVGPPSWASIRKRSCASSATRRPRSPSSWRQARRGWRTARTERSRRRNNPGAGPMPLARSFLYVPANREKFLDKAIGLPADALLLDLEDSVPAAEKAVARAAVREFAPRIPDERVWVRPNAIDSDVGRADLDAIVGVRGVAGIFAPKVETREEVLLWDRLIGELERQRGLTVGATRFVPSIESARGVLFAYDLAVAAGRVVSLSFGGARDGDLNTDLGCT